MSTIIYIYLLLFVFSFGLTLGLLDKPFDRLKALQALRQAFLLNNIGGALKEIFKKAEL